MPLAVRKKYVMRNGSHNRMVTVRQSNVAKTYVVNRRSAFGDCIQAYGIATALKEILPTVSFRCIPHIAKFFEGQKGIPVGAQLPSVNVIDLDQSYEGFTHPEIRTRHRSLIMSEVATRELRQYGIEWTNYWNLAPILTPDADMAQRFGNLLAKYPRPYIGVVPRSESSPHRTVPGGTWGSIRDERTWIWTGTDPAPAGYVDLKVRTMRELMALLSLMDIVVACDTGPVHIAAAIGKPIVMIEQATNPDLILSDQRDFNKISTGLSCLNCHCQHCHINAQYPPCGLLDAQMARDAVTRKLSAYSGDSVSVVIPILGSNKERLNRCLSAALPQVEEVVISADGDGAYPAGLVTDQKIKIVKNPAGIRRGYARTCNYGARNSSGRYIVFLNDDCFLEHDAIRHLKSAIKSDPMAGIAGCQLWYSDGTIQHGGTVRGPRDFFHKDHRVTIPTLTRITEMEHVTHACVMIPREVFYSIRGYDERYDMYCDDSDMNIRLMLAGYKVLYQPDAKGIHDDSQTTTAHKSRFHMESQAKLWKRWQWWFESTPPK